MSFTPKSFDAHLGLLTLPVWRNRQGSKSRIDRNKANQPPKQAFMGLPKKLDSTSRACALNQPPGTRAQLTLPSLLCQPPLQTPRSSGRALPATLPILGSCASCESMNAAKPTASQCSRATSAPWPSSQPRPPPNAEFKPLPHRNLPGPARLGPDLNWRHSAKTQMLESSTHGAGAAFRLVAGGDLGGLARTQATSRLELAMASAENASQQEGRGGGGGGN